MTPAITILRKNKIHYQLHEYSHDSTSESYGFEASEKLSVVASRIFKTLLVKLDDSESVVSIIPVCAKLSMKSVAKAFNAKKAEMTERLEVQRSTGYVLGGVSPIGQKKALRTLIDISALHHTSILISGGRRGLEIELSPQDLKNLTNADFSNLIQKSV